MHDSKYFSSTKKGSTTPYPSFFCVLIYSRPGELVEWRQDLVRGGQDVAKATIKRGMYPNYMAPSVLIDVLLNPVIAAMTVGKDVSSLFPDIINCMQTEDIELKKLVYLYAINYARSNPDLAILAVNTFVKVR
jgi:AP-1 complex subunit beta-1